VGEIEAMTGKWCGTRNGYGLARRPRYNVWRKCITWRESGDAVKSGQRRSVTVWSGHEFGRLSSLEEERERSLWLEPREEIGNALTVGFIQSVVVHDSLVQLGFIRRRSPASSTSCHPFLRSA
jgi:hypothetical protein